MLQTIATVLSRSPGPRESGVGEVVEGRKKKECTKNWNGLWLSVSVEVYSYSVPLKILIMKSFTLDVQGPGLSLGSS